MKIQFRQLFLICCLAAVSTCLLAQTIQNEWDNVENLVIIGDIHGDYDNYFDVLREAGIVNRRGNWTGKESHLVQVGDVPDRGPDTSRIIEHLQKLEKQAERAGGKVHVLIGNHEYMNITGDLRYVHPGEYEALTSRNSSRLRDAYYQQTLQYIAAQNETREEPLIIDEAFTEKWYNDYPLGYVEHRLAWQPGGEINNWVSGHNSIIRINDMLFMHAGLGPEMLDMSITQINEKIRTEILNTYQPSGNLGESETGPLWYRGLASNPEVSEKPHLENLLTTYSINKVIVGHTPDLGVITPRFGGSVVVTDTGMASYYGGHKASMVVNREGSFALQSGELIPLPQSEEEMIPYFQAMVALLPENQRLKNHLELLINPLPVMDTIPETETGEEADANID